MARHATFEYAFISHGYFTSNGQQRSQNVYHKVFDAAAYPRFLLLCRWHMYSGVDEDLKIQIKIQIHNYAIINNDSSSSLHAVRIEQPIEDLKM